MINMRQEIAAIVKTAVDAVLPQSTHFRIERTAQGDYAVLAKRNAVSNSRAMLPMPASADSPELLVDELQSAEAWYAANRKLVDGRK
jgi:hypothetical protein